MPPRPYSYGDYRPFFTLRLTVLFDLESDPDEQENLIDHRPKGRFTILTGRVPILRPSRSSPSHRQKTARPRKVGPPDHPDQYRFAAAQASIS